MELKDYGIDALVTFFTVGGVCVYDEYIYNYVSILIEKNKIKVYNEN